MKTLPNKFTFTHYTHTTYLYTATKLEGKDSYEVSWIEEGEEDISKTKYSVDSVEKYVNGKKWVNVVTLDEPLVKNVPILANVGKNGMKVSLTARQKATQVDSNTLTTVTRQAVAGGGDKNLIIWALAASKLGYKKLVITTPNADNDVKTMLASRVKNANEMINHLGLVVELGA